ncbi:MAG: efflux RND transporter periplasmic adaptor subunit [Candidatus Eisenbacteria bacterium]|uniref:Efflux RND transporter periplasmic adaptor subunit n=1 Tax=Eiseniibacteriota bacterium TaxID=2212470 RepID=A0A956NCS3_UNCEI|nr:efflux RND transporter periplasmic adaptor subunit [Candidatus Eisenbacteria bacterium]
MSHREVGYEVGAAGESPPTARRGSVALKVLGGLASLAIVVVLLAWPLHIHPFDRWVHSIVGGKNVATSGELSEAGDQIYTCPMHPDILVHEPGSCPICGMNLVPVKDGGSTAAMEKGHGAGGSMEMKDSPSSGVSMEPGHSRSETQSDGSETQLWTCGMHPQVIQEEPGSCPICGMNLVPLRSDAASDGSSDLHDKGSGTQDTEQAGSRKILFYRSPMDPSLTSPVPRKDEMGMDYVPVYADEGGSAGKQGAVVTIDPTVVQNMNVTTELVRRQDVRRQIRTVGYLDYDQEKMVSVTTKYPGFIEKVHANYVGQPVRKGDPLFQVYSPELVQTEQELLSARRYADKLKDAPGDAAQRAEALYQAARARLGYWDISPDQIDRLEETGQVFRTLTVTAPARGVIMKRMDGLDGMAIKPGMELMHIADLSTLWLSVEVFENQLPWVAEGSSAEVTLDYFPGEAFTGTVRYVEPQISEKTRSVSLTLEIANPQRRLRAGMYATVRFQPVVAKNAITVPSQAILRTGERDLIVVALGEGRFAPREVELGPEGDGFAQVLSGLADGDRVVTSSQFLIDSESNLRAAIQKMIAERTAK